MAVSLSNHSLLLPSVRFPSSKPSSKTPLPLLSLPYSSRPAASLLSNSFYVNSRRHSSINRRYSFAATHDSSRSVNGKDNGHESDVKTVEADQKQVLNLKNLIKIYREAILNGDENTVADIEAKINVIENENNELVQKVLALSEEITSGKEKYIRLQADFDNFRKRSDKERLNIRSDAQGEVIESLLPMVDSFERAKQQLKPETDKEKKIDMSYQGIYKQFVEIMRSLKVAAVATVGRPFDPSLHEAIAREESQEYKEGIIVQEFRRGFILGDRLLRPAMVKVSSGPGQKKTSVGAATAAGVDD